MVDPTGLKITGRLASTPYKERGIMMYRNNFVVVVKHKGKVLRESNSGVVRLPFGSDYSILLKNKDSRSAVADVEIDGEDVATGVIVPGNDSVELKGAINGLNVSNHFRFIEKTREISNFRGDREDDGLVRVEYRFEQYDVIRTPIRPMKKKGYSGYDPWTYNSSNEVMYGATCDNFTLCSSDAGITVPGKETNQNFEYGHTKPLEMQSHVIVLHLKGAVKKHKKVRKIRKAVTVKTRLQCSSCGRRSKYSMKFCGNCGTYLR